MGSMRQLCKNGMLLVNGKVAFIGEINETIEAYLSTSTSVNDVKYFEEIDLNAIAQITEIKLFNDRRELRSNFLSNEKVIIAINYKINVDAPNARIVLQLTTKNGEIAFASTCYLNKKSNSIEVVIPSNLLNSNSYYVRLNLGEPGVRYLTEPKEYVGFVVDTVGQHGAKASEKWPGVVSPKLEWFQK